MKELEWGWCCSRHKISLSEQVEHWYIGWKEKHLSLYQTLTGQNKFASVVITMTVRENKTVSYRSVDPHFDFP